MEDLAAVGMKIQPFLTNGGGGQHEWPKGGVERVADTAGTGDGLVCVLAIEETYRVVGTEPNAFRLRLFGVFLLESVEERFRRVALDDGGTQAEGLIKLAGEFLLPADCPPCSRAGRFPSSCPAAYRKSGREWPWSRAD